MNKSGLWLMLLLLTGAPLQATAQGYQSLEPAFSAADMAVDPYQSRSHIEVPIFNNATHALQNNPLEAVISKAGQVMIQWPMDAINYGQVQDILRQVPGANNLLIQFPNATQWSTSRGELSGLEKILTSQISNGAGIGVGNLNIKEMVFSSLSQVASANGGKLAIPIAQIKNGLEAGIAPMLNQLRYQQSEIMGWMPDWLRDLCYSIYEFVMPYIMAAYSWFVSFL